MRASYVAERRELEASRIAEEEREIAGLRERLTRIESLQGELAALRNAIAGATSGANIAAQGNSR